MVIPLLQISWFIIQLIRGYQLVISPLLGSNCRFNPTCSHYGIEVIYQFGILRGSWLILKRILKCHPLNPGGEDPIPTKFFGNREH